jgi:hypothetical protein
MANAITTSNVVRSRSSAQFQSFFSEMWTVKGTITDQDSISATDTARFVLTVPGVALGDMILGVSVTNNLSDATDQITVTAFVSIADTVIVQAHADAGAFAADNMNGNTVRVLIGRPTW